MKTKFLAIGVFACAAAMAAERIGDWYVNVPAEVLKKMSMSERTCAERALKQLDGGSARAAANEWKRFNTEFITTASEEALAWASFFQAYSLNKAKDSFKAIELSSETIELYPDSKASCASLFFRGAAQGANGQVQKAMADYRELVDNEQFASHPLAYTAHNRLAWNQLQAGKLKEAMQEWQVVTELKRDAHRAEWDSAKRNLSTIESLSDPAAKLTDLATRFADNPKKGVEEIRNWRNSLWWTVWHDEKLPHTYFESHKGKAKDVRSAEIVYLVKLTKAFETQAEAVYKAAGSEWEFLMTQFDATVALVPKSADKMINKVGGEVRKVADKQLQSDRAVAFIRKLREMKRITEAKLFLDLIQDPVKRAWTGAEIGWTARDGNYIVECLKPIEAMPDPSVADSAKRNHAKCCQELLKDYDGAIKFYEEAPQPPATLWSVADCHRAAGRKPKAQAVLDEICSMFPNDAPNAMLRKGDWYRDDGDKKNAIGCYRRILAHAEWKKAGAASQAHQRLEAFGIGTGGAVLNDVH